jgi:hypothetical protein
VSNITLKYTKCEAVLGQKQISEGVIDKVTTGALIKKICALSPLANYTRSKEVRNIWCRDIAGRYAYMLMRVIMFRSRKQSHVRGNNLIFMVYTSSY